MQIKKVLIHAFILGVAAASYHVDPSIDWSASCTDRAVAANWVNIRTTLNNKIPYLRSVIGSVKYNQVVALLGGIRLPTTPNIAIEHALVNIIGANLMEQYIGAILQNYWRRYPCTEPTQEPSSPVYSESSEVSSPPPYSTEVPSSEAPSYTASSEEPSSELPTYSAPNPSSEEPSYTASSEEPSYTASYTASSEEPSYTASSEEPSYTASSEEPSYTASSEEPSYTASSEEPSYTASSVEPSSVYSTSEPDYSTSETYSRTKVTVTVTLTSSKCPIAPTSDVYSVLY
ncbi:hypothetical protein GGH96_005220 [Coemansia sp. RSA 1972]|nr:hypothetical protein GGH96_005220 [Coemansia sp. RSA 1972]